MLIFYTELLLYLLVEAGQVIYQSKGWWFNLHVKVILRKIPDTELLLMCSLSANVCVNAKKKRIGRRKQLYKELI